ncbi:MAG: DUF2309 domain-containing protein [Magnetococcales bacterium]|nr:DUF2309 domain-containing protein [Magnetococcales bacterium]
MHHRLPGQAPIRDFVHHNTLHGLQHLPFHEALAEAERLYGIHGYLPLAQFRHLYQQGRITRADLEHEIRDAADLAVTDDRRLEIYRTILLHDLRPISAEQLRWRLEADDLWSACLEVLPSSQPDSSDSSDDPLLTTLFDRMGRDMTLRGLLLALTGQDILDDMRPLLLRHLSGWIDQGSAACPYPERSGGLWQAFRRVLLQDPALALEQLPNADQEIAGCPDDSRAALQKMLQRSGVPEKRWDGYLERLALELPGWSGMMLWRHLHPGYQGLLPQQVDMIDYLAVRLLLERLYAARLCQRLWQMDPRVDLLRWYGRGHVAEFRLRCMLFDRSLPEHLAHAVQQLLQPADGEVGSDDQWQQLLQQLQPRHEHDRLGHQAWPLFQLVRHLGLTGTQLRQMGQAAVDEMLACIDQLDEQRCGQIWLQAYERHYRDQIFNALLQNQPVVESSRPVAQLLFCMDDREEGFRRHLEEHNPAIETFGAAGFFGVAINWRGLDDSDVTALCPVVVTPVHEIQELPQTGFEQRYDQHQQRRRQWFAALRWLHQRSRHGVWQPLLAMALTAPAAMMLMAGKLLAPQLTGQWVDRYRNRYLLSLPTRLVFKAADDAPPATAEQPRLGLTDEEQADRVERLLRTIGLTDRWAPLVVILGHGSSSDNNPHRSAYDCGACSGRHGGPNARLMAVMANRPQVRQLLRQRGLEIPDRTWFFGAQHDTCDESINWFDLDQLPPQWRQPLDELRRDLDKACALSAHERARKLASASLKASPEQARRHMVGRAKDFSQPRPELGHVTNAVAVIGRRALSQGLFFDRRMFLISYDPQHDDDGRIIEAILLAAGPVGAGINLEYYFSTINNDRYGCGSKVTHNLTGLLGVMEGSSSDLRTGLPRQMIEIHEAMRLLVIVEQRCETLTRIYQEQQEIRELVGNGWIHLAAIEPGEPQRIFLFIPQQGWQPWTGPLQPLPQVNRSAEWYQGHRHHLPPAQVTLRTVSPPVPAVSGDP